MIVRPTEYAVPVTTEERAQQGMVHPERLKTEPASGGWEPATAGATSIVKIRSPGDVVRKDTLGVLSLVMMAGFLAGTFLQLKPVRKGVKQYGTVQNAAKLW